MRQFIAEIKKVEAKKLVSNDMQVSITLVTDDVNVLDLGKVPPEELVLVKIVKEKS